MEIVFTCVGEPVGGRDQNSWERAYEKRLMPPEEAQGHIESLSRGGTARLLSPASKLARGLLDAVRIHAATRSGTQCESTSACRYRGR